MKEISRQRIYFHSQLEERTQECEERTKNERKKNKLERKKREREREREKKYGVYENNYLMAFKSSGQNLRVGATFHMVNSVTYMNVGTSRIPM